MRKGKFIVNINGNGKKRRSALINKKEEIKDVNDSYIDELNDDDKDEAIESTEKMKELKKRKAYEDSENDFKFEEELLDEFDKKYDENEDSVDEDELYKRTVRSANDNKRIDDGIDIINKYKEKIDEKRKKRIGKTYHEAKQEYVEKKIAEKKVYKTVKNMVVLVIVLALFIFLFLLYEYGPIFGISLDKFDTNKEKKIDMVTTDSDIYTNYNEDLLVYSNQKITTYNKNAKKTWEYELDSMFNPSIYTFEAYLAIANNTTGNIYLFENKKEILDIRIDGTINHIYLDEFGNMAVEYSTTGYKKVVGVYNKKGKNLYNAYLENDSIVDLRIIENANKLLIFQTSSASSKIGVKVNLIDGTKAENNLTQIAKFDNNFVYDLTIQGRNIIIVLDDRLAKLNIDSGNITDIKKFESSQISFISLTDNYFTTIEKELNDEKNNYRINMQRFDNTQISSTSIENLPKLMQNSGLLNYFVYQDHLSVINKWGIEIKKESLSITPKSIIIFNGQKAIALVYTNKIRVIKI